jgi:hypothetical protein
MCSHTVRSARGPASRLGYCLVGCNVASVCMLVRSQSTQSAAAAHAMPLQCGGRAAAVWQLLQRQVPGEAECCGSASLRVVREAQPWQCRHVGVCLQTRLGTWRNLAPGTSTAPWTGVAKAWVFATIRKKSPCSTQHVGPPSVPYGWAESASGGAEWYSWTWRVCAAP